MNLKLENQLSNIVGNSTYNKFKERPKNVTMAAFMKSTFFNKRTNKPDNGTSNERKQVVDKESPTSKDKSHGNIKESLVEDEDSTGTDTDVVTDPKVSTNNVDKGTNIQDNCTRKPLEKDENKTDTDSSNISSE